MIPGLSGSLLSLDALVNGSAALPLPADSAPARRRIEAIVAEATAEIGPASGARAVFDRLATPLAEALGFEVILLGGRGEPLLRAELRSAGRPAAVMLVAGWDADAPGLWRDAVHLGIACGVRWCLAVGGAALRVVDTRQSFARRLAEFDLPRSVADPQTFALLWGLLRAPAFGADDCLLDRATAVSEAHRVQVRASLQLGVHDALLHLVGAFASVHRRRRRPAELAALFDESLVVVYRILFLLFAEARGLVPNWHPIYRDGYTIEALRTSVERQPRPRGVWEALQAIARLAHRGCNAGSLRVPPFNGRLFSPAHAPLADGAPLDDRAVTRALVALTTRPSARGRVAIAYEDLGVEQLGGVYERVLDFEPAAPNGDVRRLTLVRTERRKTTGSYYTPRTLTEFLVRRTLSPLVREASPERILSLRVLDPAMGSGAFLVAACRFLAAAFETAAVASGLVAPGDVDEAARAGFRRTVAQRCLYGIDVNPMAVQLGRLSLWLATLAADRPLTFLDHHLRSGNSLIGAGLDDVGRAPTPGRRARPSDLPLFADASFDAAVGSAAGSLAAIAREDGDTIEQVRGKERLLADVERPDAPLARWKAVADLWCAHWFFEGGQRPPFHALADELLGRGPVLPAHVSGPLLAAARDIAARERFFHWTLEFPDVFHGEDGTPLPVSGFDAIVGNPPWEMLRGDRGPAAARAAAVAASACLTSFSRRSGVYRQQGDGHANLYQLFVERALSLTRRGGRIGIVLPSGFASDHGCARLRRHVLDSTAIDTFVSIENRDGLFPIHRSLRFLLLTATTGSATERVPCRFGVRSPETLEQLGDAASDTGQVAISRELIVRMSGDTAAIPELRVPADLATAARITYAAPALGDAEWGVTFGRELNATDDRRHFAEAPGRRGTSLPVVEGKQLQPFVVDVPRSRFSLAERTAARLLDAERTYRRPRLAYRDVASATNRLTLIAAILPAGVVTTHTLFCLKTPLDESVQLYLCGMFNSFVANYLVRLRVGTHVSAGIIDRLRMPRPPAGSAGFVEVADLSRRLARHPDDRQAAASLQARAARLYGLTAGEFRHVLDTFPLVALEERNEAMREFGRLDAV